MKTDLNYTWEQIVIAMTSTSEALREFPPNIYWYESKIKICLMILNKHERCEMRCFSIDLYVLSFIIVTF